MSEKMVEDQEVGRCPSGRSGGPSDPSQQAVSAVPAPATNAAHTPGPWEIYRQGTTYYNGPTEAGDPFVITAPNDGVILAVVIPDAVPQFEANAHIMFAALDLRDAATDALNYVESIEAELGAELATGARVRAALAKARGES